MPTTRSSAGPGSRICDSALASRRANAIHLTVGWQLPEAEIDISATLIVGGAIATRDFFAPHHDRSAAISLGMSDIFMNLWTTTGLVNRYVTDQWPEAILRKVEVKLGTPNYPGHVMKMSGRIDALARRDGTVDATVAVRGETALGVHVTASVLISMPDGST